MYDTLVSLLIWTAAGSVSYLVVYLLRCKLADRRERKHYITFTKNTYDVAILRAAKDTRRVYHIYMSVPEGATSDTAYLMYLNKRSFLKAIFLREARERKHINEGYRQTW